MDIEGKQVLVTGGCGGMGLAIGQAFAECGLDVVLADRSIKAADALRSRYTNVSALEVDLADPERCRASLAPLVNGADAPDILVNAIGIGSVRAPDGSTRMLMDTAIDDWMRVMRVNLDAVFHCISLALPAMQKRQSGRIINIASMAPRIGGVRTAGDYVASKAAVIGLTKAVAAEVARQGITVNAINPGKVETPMISHLVKENAEVARTIPIGRLGTPEDVASAALYLASKGAAYITGSAIELNGGQYMGA